MPRFPRSLLRLFLLLYVFTFAPTLVCFYVSVLAPAPLLVCLFGDVDNKRLENPSDHIGVAHSLCCYL